MKILFAINRDAIQSNLTHTLLQTGVNLDYDPDRDSVFSKDLIIEKIKYNLNSQDSKYDIVIINEKLDGEYDLIEIVKFLTKNNIRPIVLLGNRADNDPLIHALIKRKVYDFMYGKLKLEDIIRSVTSPRTYADIEHLVDIVADEYKIQGKGISDTFFESGGSSFREENIIDGDAINAAPKGPAVTPPSISQSAPKSSSFPGIKGIKDVISGVTAPKAPPVQRAQNNAPERVVVQQQFVAQLPEDYKKNIAIYSNQQVGKSFVACNLATMFAAKGKKTVLVDLDFKNKSQYYYFDMSQYEAHVKTPRDMNIIAKVFEADTEESEELIHELFSPMRNLYVITSHPDLDIKEYDLDTLFRVYVMLKNMFDVVIYDLPADCSEHYMRLIMTQVEDVFIITNQNCSILDRTEKDLRDVMSGYFVNNKVTLLINQYVNHSDMTKNSIKEHLSVIESHAREIEINFKNVFTIPNNYYVVVDSIAKGKPAVTFDSDFRMVFEDMANKYYPDVTSRRRG